MGGDHKCPVCQATFTRPQHVARHMRSHTGDRPYKCHYCGDQFARSDLLARHINKCHANEKPVHNSVPGGRRKGSAATSRATTSKQACDQCVQASLPCDGSNPCSKCVSRKSRCTYVKFHRQTAPSGPGHQPPRSPSSSSSSLTGGIESSRFPPSQLDTFVLAPPPSTSILPPGSFSGSDQIFNTPFTLNTPAPATYPPSWTTPEVAQLYIPMTSDADMAAKYRAQAEFLRRTGHSFLSNTPSTTLPNPYTTQQQQQPPTSNWYPAWGESAACPALDDTKSFESISRTHSLASSEPASFAPELYGPYLIGSAYRPRRTSLDFSDSSSATSHSVPSSATSSSVQLPLVGNEVYDGSEEIQRQVHDEHILQHQRRASMPATQLPPFPPPSDPQQPSTQLPHRVGEGNFSSAFGLMTIDDPNVLANLSSDGLPFFSNLGMGVLPHSPNATPMPTRVQHPHSHQGRDRQLSLGALPTPGLTKEGVDNRELKDMWKTFLRSPLSGSGTAIVDLCSNPPMPQSPSGRRRARVSSLPSVTPTVEKGHPLGRGEMCTSPRAPTMMSTMHGNADDLRSYEAAVNARSAPLKLNLVPKRKGTRPSLNASPSGEKGPGCVAGRGHGEHVAISRPSSSSSTSSLAQALTAPSSQHHPHPHASLSMSSVVKPPPMQGASISLPVPPTMPMYSNSMAHSNMYGAGFGSSTSLTFEPSSRASSVASDGTGTGGSGSEGEAFRPSFKRYASQTLGPANSKRAMVERKSGEGHAKGGIKMESQLGVGRSEADGMKGFEDVPGVRAVGPGSGSGSPGSRPMAALPERAKRV